MKKFGIILFAMVLHLAGTAQAANLYWDGTKTAVNGASDGGVGGRGGQRGCNLTLDN